MTTSSATCSGSAVASTIIGIDAAGLGDQRHDRAVLGGQRAVDRAADLGRAGEADAGDARDRRPARRRPCRRRAPGASAFGGMPAACRMRTASAAISGVCSAGLATTRVAGGKRGGHLAEEDRERKIPRADADEHAAAAIAQLVALAGRARHRLRERACAAPRAHSSGRNRPPRELPRAHRRASCRPPLAAARSAGRAALPEDRSRARARRRASRPASPPSRRSPPPPPPWRPSRWRASASRTRPIAVPSIGEQHGALAAGAAVPSISGAASVGRRGVADFGEQAAEARAVAELDAARNCARSGAIEIARQRDIRMARAGARPRSAAADARGSRQSAPPDRPRPRRTTSSRRSRAAAAPDRRAGRDVRRPAHRPGRRPAADRRAADRRAPRPCRAGAGTRSLRPRRHPRSRSATVRALWVANCG